MKATFLFSFIFLLLLIPALQAQKPEIFELTIYAKHPGDSVGFISLSDIASLSNHPDSLAIPDLREKAENEAKNFEYLTLDGKSRKNFLSGIKVSETDKVFIYDYSKNILKTFTVKDLKVLAHLSIYGADWPYSQYDYMIGFEIDRKLLEDFGSFYYHTTLVSIGQKSPFVQEQLKHITWKKIESKDFPFHAISMKDTGNFKESRYVPGNMYTYETNNMRYFIQDLMLDDRISVKRFLVLNSQSTKKVFETLYYEGESASFTSLEYQWTGKLFKKKPPVIFWFRWHSFGCPEITFLDPKEEELYINCDNRH